MRVRSHRRTGRGKGEARPCIDCSTARNCGAINLLPARDIVKFRMNPSLISPASLASLLLSPAYPPKGFGTEAFYCVGDRTFKIEVFTKVDREGDWIAEQVWLTDMRKPWRHALLSTPLFIPHEGRPFDRFTVSPDERVILAERAVYSGVNEIFCFVRQGGAGSLFYRLTSAVSLNKQIVKRYGRSPEERRRRPDEDEANFLLFEMWQRGGRDAAFVYRCGKRRTPATYAITLDTVTGNLHHYRRIHRKQI